jgi:ubiquinone/menaquinone biosynthesis C-methylase UbiE
MKQRNDYFIDRWRKAQQAEKKSYNYQQEIYWSTDTCKQYLSTNFGITFELFRDKKVLEVGAGLGLINFTNVPCFNVGIDPLYHYLRPRLTSSTAHLITGIGEKLPFKDRTFDIVLCLNVLDHCINPEEVLKEIRRVLKEKGLFIFHLNTFQLPKFLNKKLSLIDLPHPHHFSFKEAIALIKKFGFKIVRIKETKPSFGKWKNFVAFLLFRFKILYIMAEKNI